MAIGSAIVSNVQASLNSEVANIQLVRTTSAIDKSAIISLFNQYQTRDLATLLTVKFCGSFLTPGEIAAVKPNVDSGINLAYLNAVVQVNAL